MPDIYLIIDLFVVISLAVLGLTVLIKNRALELNRIFSTFVVFVGIWIMANYVSNNVNNSPHTATVANYFVFFFSFSSALYLLRFSISMANDMKARRTFMKAAIPLTLVGLSAFTPYLVKGVHLQNQVYAVDFGPLLPLYGVALFGIIAATLWVLRRNIRQAEGNQRSRLQVLYKSAYLTFPLLLLAEFILPTVTGWFGLTNLGILTMLIIVYGLYYGVIKHKLFDLRLIIVRAVVYVVSFGSISVLYGVATYFITSYVSSRTHSVILGDALNVLLLIIVINAYPPLRARFNKITNSIFYRDAYDSPTFIAAFNKVLVSTYDLNPLLKKSATIIEQNLKLSYCAFGLRETDSSPRRITGTPGYPSFSESDIAFVRSQTPSLKRKIIVTESLEDKYSKLRKVLDANNIAALARLATGSNKEEATGYLIIGPKKSGYALSAQDTKVLEIISNELVIAIQNAARTEEILNFNQTLQAKVDEATRKMRRTNEKLKALDETKDDFISMASHQLRTPLTSVKGYISMVLEGDAGKINDTQREMLGQAFFSSQRMVYLISDLLNVSRLKTGKFVIDATQVDLVELVQQEMHQLEESAVSRSLTLTFEAPKDFPTLMFDETKTRQIIMNFVDNAIYYTPAGGHIVVRLLNNPSTVELRVEDDGIGVPKADQHHLFTKFYRAANARQARPDGTGLGLFMAKKVIAAQGGSTLFSSSEGKGSMFGFVFSKAKLQPPDSSAAPVKQL